jgi:hypothetical protein
MRLLLLLLALTAIAVANLNGAVDAYDAPSNSWVARLDPCYYGAGTQANSGISCVTFGAGASTLGSMYGVATGFNATATGFGGTAISYGARALAQQSISIGKGSIVNTTAAEGQAIGTYASSQAYAAMSYGYSSLASGQYSQAAGTSANALADYSIANGPAAFATAINATATGRGARADVPGGIAHGTYAKTNGVLLSMAFGTLASPNDAAHALAYSINPASVLPRTIGITINGVSRVLSTDSSLFSSTAGAGPTALTAASSRRQWFTTAQTVSLPDVATLQAGVEYKIVNLSTGNVLVNSSDGTLKISLSPNQATVLTCEATTPSTGAATWTAEGPWAAA